jgi:hypothetical protein
MNARDWSPREAASLLRQAREAATPTADLALIEAAIQAGLAEIKIVQSLAEGGWPGQVSIWPGTRQMVTAMKFHSKRRGRLDFPAISRAALASLPALLRRWLPDGRLVGREYEARNPTRADRRPGSFRVNVSTGKWADFATGDVGGDVVSLAAYLSGTGQAEAACALADMLGLRHD